MTGNTWKALVALLVFTMGTSIITPLMALYQEHFDLSNGVLTLLFVTYTATVVPTMLLAGNLSDSLGRKRLMIPGMISISLASIVFSLADSVAMLFVGRVFQGLAIGMFLGVGTAFVVDQARSDSKARAAMAGGIAFRLGFGLGPLMAGIIAQYGSDSLHRPFEVHLVLMVVGFSMVLWAPETVARRPLRFALRVGVPHGQMRGFAGFLAPAAFVMSFMEGTLLSVVPLYLYQTLGEKNVAIAGLVGFLVLGLGAVTPFVIERIEPRKAVMLGVGTSSLLTLLVVAASGVGTAALVVLAAASIGFFNGFILQGGTVICGTVVPLHERGKLLSALYMCAYAGTTPVVVLGFLSGAVGLTVALAVFSGVAIAIATWVLVVGRRLFPEVVPYVETVHAPRAEAARA